MTKEPDLPRLEIRRMHTAWMVEKGHFELQPDHKFGAWLYEPLDTDAPADAHVNVCLSNTVQFYHPANEHSSGKFHNYKEARFMDMVSVADTVVHVAGAWWQRQGGRVLRRNERWVFRHTLVRNTRLAHLLNKGPKGDSYMPTYDDLMRHETTEKGHILHCGNCRERWFQPNPVLFKPFTYCPFCNQEVRQLKDEGAVPARERVTEN